MTSMSSRSLLLFTILIPSIYSVKPSLKLTFTPDEKYYTQEHQVDIACELLNPADPQESAQLWHVDLKTGKHTTISRALINGPPDDAPDVFKQNRNKRVEYIKKNYIRVRRLALEDSARYECNCPDCEEAIPKQSKDLQVMKLVEPRWHIEPGWPMQENAKTMLRCTTDDFYPYVMHKIVRNHHDISNEGKATPPNSNTYPQRFSWEATVSPTADWHNSTLRCTVTQGSFRKIDLIAQEMRLVLGNSEQHAFKYLDVLFTPRFLKCEERQHVDSTKEKSTIECSYSGNPQPRLNWYRQSDGRPLNSDLGVTVETVDEHHGKYKSIVSFDRDKLTAIPLTTTTRAPNAPVETSTPARVLGDNYYQQLLNGGVVAKLLLNNNEEKGAKKITIFGDANQVRANLADSASISSIQCRSTSILFFSLTLLLFVIQHP